MAVERRVLAIVLALASVSVGTLAGAQGPGSPGPGNNPAVAAVVREQAAQNGRVRVLVELRLASGPFMPESTIGNSAGVQAQRNAIALSRARVLSTLTPATVRVVRQFETTPYIAIEVTPAALAALEANGADVVRVLEDGLARPSLIDSVPHVQGDQVWQVGIEGDGVALAVLDSGVDASHPFLGGRVVAEACFSSTTSGLSQSVCPNGLETQVGPGAAAPCGLADCLHGTHVAGIAAGNGDTTGEQIWGVARKADIMAVQVFSEVTDDASCGGQAPCLGAFESDLIAGLEQVYAAAVNGDLNLAAANLSLGGGLYPAPCDEEPFKPIIDNLRAIGVATVVASGNSYDPTNLSSPACVSSAISVGSTSLADQVSDFSNVAPFLSLFAPGEDIISSVPGGGYAAFSGTSMAAPHVAGAWALMHEAVPEASVDDVLNALQATGLPVTDTRFWAPGTTTAPRIRIFQALASLTPLTSPVPELASVSPLTVRAGLSATLTLTGAGFNGTSVARWNGVDVPTTAVSITTLKAAVPAEMVALGTSFVSVFNPEPGGGTSAALPIEVLPPPVLSVNVSEVGPGGSATVALTNGYGGRLDWLAVAAAGAADSSYLQSTFVGDGVTERTWTVNMPTTPGDYEFRLFLDNGFVRASTSPTVTVDAAISPLPVISSITPSQAVAGSAGFTLVVYGSSFVSTSTVRWNGSARPTTFVNASQLRATIAATDLAASGTVDVSVHTPTPGGGTSATLPFTVTEAPSLTVSETSVVGGNQVTVTLANGLGGSSDWLAFALTSAPNNSYVQFIYVGAGVTERTWTVTTPTTAGTYEFRLFKQASFVRLATSEAVTVAAPPPPTLAVDTTSAAPGAAVTVTLTNGLGGTTDWLAFAPTGAANNSYVQFVYVGAGVTERTWTVTMPQTATGTYEFRLFKQASFVRLATSPAVAVAGTPPPSPTLAVNTTSVAAGGQVTVTLTNGTGGPTDFLTLATSGTPNNSYWQTTSVGAGVTTRTWTVTMPQTAGTYEFRLFADTSFTRLATSPTVTVQSTTPPAEPVLTVSADTVTGGQQVTVTLTGGLGGSSDWLAFASTGAASNSYLFYTYVGNGVTERTWTVTTPTTGGTYEFRLFKQASFVRLATSPPITVEPPPPPTLTVDKTSAAPGEQVTVTLTNGLGNATDWLAFAPTGAANNSYLFYTYVGNGVTERTWTVTMPSAPGTYEFRLFKLASFVRVATSPTVTSASP